MVSKISQDDVLKASKFIKHQFFLSSQDLKRFFHQFEKIVYIPVGKVFEKDEPIPSIDEFFVAYQTYESRLLSAEQKDVNDLRLSLSGAFSLDEKAFGFQEIQSGKKIFKPIKPVMQFQLLSFIIGIDHKIHFTLGKETTYFGLQVLFPQLFIDQDNQIKNGLKEEDSPNANLFRKFVSFLRDETHLITFQLPQGSLKSTIRVTQELFDQIKTLSRYQSFKMEI